MRWQRHRSALVRRLGAQANVGAAIFPVRSSIPTTAAPRAKKSFPPAPATRSRRVRAVSTARSPGHFPRDQPALGDVARRRNADLRDPGALLPTLAALPGADGRAARHRRRTQLQRRRHCDATNAFPTSSSSGCTTDVNCCSPALYGPASCLDDVATLAASRGTSPNAGSRPTSWGFREAPRTPTLLDELARTGGTARPAGSGGAALLRRRALDRARRHPRRHRIDRHPELPVHLERRRAR